MQLLVAAPGMFWQYVSAVVSTVYIITVGAIIVMIIHQKRDPAKTTVWVLALAMLPMLGLLLYVFFGRNHRKEKLFGRKGLHDQEQMRDMSADQLVQLHSNRALLSPKVADYASHITLLLNNNKALLTEYNELELLHDGQQAFSSIIDALGTARHSIHMLFYIVSDDRIGNRIKQLLIEKARAGVHVRLIYDDVGSWHLPSSFAADLRAAGVEVQPFMPVRMPALTSKANYRNHRKIVVVDGLVGYLGGMNIADRYIDGHPRLGPWIDTMLRLRGEAVHSLQAIFFTDWSFVAGHDIADRAQYFPKAPAAPYLPLQIATSGPDSDWANIMQAYFYAITRARDHIYIASPYFIPNESVLTALKTAALGGTDVRIMLPGQSDSRVVYWSSRSYVQELLDAGIKVYMLHHAFNHSKVMMVDSSCAFVGSANMDIRSFEDNFEVAAIVYDRDTTRQLEATFMQHLQRCVRIDAEEWSNRPIRTAFVEAMARIISPLF